MLYDVTQYLLIVLMEGLVISNLLSGITLVSAIVLRFLSNSGAIKRKSCIYCMGCGFDYYKSRSV